MGKFHPDSRTHSAESVDESFEHPFGLFLRQAQDLHRALEEETSVPWKRDRQGGGVLEAVAEQLGNAIRGSMGGQGLAELQDAFDAAENEWIKLGSECAVEGAESLAGAA